jgi:hypothetical protein
MESDGLVSKGTFVEFSWHSFETDGSLDGAKAIEEEPDLHWLLKYRLASSALTSADGPMAQPSTAAYPAYPRR